MLIFIQTSMGSSGALILKIILQNMSMMVKIIDWSKKIYIVKKALRLLAENPRHPSLQTKPVERAPGIYEARVDQRYRLTYERLAGDVLRMRVVGKHDTALKKP